MTVKTIGTGTGLNVTPDYTTLALWESYLNGLGTFTQDQIGRVLWNSSANELSGAQTCNWDGSTPSTFNIILEAGDLNGAAGGSFKDHANKVTNALRYNTSNGAAILASSGSGNSWQLNDPNITIRNLQMKSTLANNAYMTGFTSDGPKTIQNCIIVGAGATSGALIAFDGVSTLTNCLIYWAGTGNGNGSSNASFANYLVTQGSGAGGPGTITNCTLGNVDTSVTSRPGLGADYAACTITAQNCAIVACGKDYLQVNGVTKSLTFCATDLTSGTSGLPAANNNQYSLVGTTEFQNLTAGTEDFRLKSTSVKCKDLGTTAGAPGIDIVGATRP